MQNQPISSRHMRRSLLLGALIGMGIALVFAAGFFFRDWVGLTPALALSSFSDSADGYPLLDEVQMIIDQHYLREQPPTQTREYAAIRGMLSALEDRYTFFIEPPVAQSESDVLAGTYGGIGVLVQRNEAGEIVLIPFPDGPAAAAGIRDNDVLLRVNGSDLDTTLSQDQIDQMLRGEVRDGSGVELTVRHQADDAEETVYVPFAVINVPSVVWRMLAEDERMGYVQVLRFTSRTPEELRTALGELRDAGALALVVDMRNNTGGLLQESIAVADEFLDDETLALEVDNAGERGFPGTAGGAALDLPLAVLVNGGTASGAELVAGAIQDHERGFLVGQTTYGKGTIQQIFPLTDGSSLHVTSAEWFTPDRHQLTDNGLDPDVPMIPDQNGRDVELGEAVRRLQEVLTES